MMRCLLFVTLVSCAWAQVLLPPQERPRVFEIGKDSVTPADKKPVASAEIVPVAPLPALQVMADGWELVEVAAAGVTMDDGFARPDAQEALGVATGPQRGQLTVMATHRAQVDIALAQKIKHGVREFVFNPPVMMEPGRKAWDSAQSVPASVTRTVVDAQGKVVRQEMALLGAQLGSSGWVTPQGNFWAGERNENPDGFCPVGSAVVGHLMSVPTTQIKGLSAPMSVNVGAKISYVAIAAEPATGSFYLAAEKTLYRWRPSVWDKPELGGRLSILRVDRPKEGISEQEFKWEAGRAYGAYWQDPANADAALTRLDPLQGIAMRANELWLATRPGKGQLMVLKGDKLSVVTIAGGPELPGVLCATPTGELLAVDDKAPARLMLLTRENAWKELLRCNSTGGKMTGVALSPDGKWIFVSVQGPQTSLIGLRRR